MLADCPIILLAVSDDAIAPVMATLRAEGLDDRTYVHFCGGRCIRGRLWRASADELPTTLYEPAFYRDIPVFVDSGPPGSGRGISTALFPGLPNPCFPLKPEDKAYYHALCALAGGMHRRALARILRRDGGPLRRAAFGRSLPIRAASSRTSSNRATAR